MNEETPTTPELIELRKYPNRRYYDASRRRHLTLEQIHALIREGSNVRVVDSQSSADITGKVLTQIIMDLDTLKLELFPTAMLTELIRVNDRYMKGFFEKFLSQAFDGFMEYQRQIGVQMQPGAGWPSFLSPFAAWTKALGQPPASPTPRNSPGRDQGGAAAGADLGGTVARLQKRVQSLERQLAAKKRPARREAAR